MYLYDKINKTTVAQRVFNLNTFEVIANEFKEIAIIYLNKNNYDEKSLVFFCSAEEMLQLRHISQARDNYRIYINDNMELEGILIERREISPAMLAAAS